MTFRTRLQAGFVFLAVVSVGGLAVGVRYEMTRRLTQEYQDRVAALVAVIRGDLSQMDQTIAGRLGSVGSALAGDNRFRLSLAEGAGSSPYVLDYAGDAMRRAGLSLLQVQDSGGRILSSGHFRNEFDREEPDLPRLLAAARVSAGSATSAPGLAVVTARSPEGPFLALARVDSVQLGGRWLYLVGGQAVDASWLRRLARERDLTVTLRLPDTTLTSVADSSAPDAGVVAAELPLAAVVANGGALSAAQAGLVVTHSTERLAQLRAGVDRWSLGAGAFAVVLAVALATWMAARLSQPLVELARKTSAMDLTRLDLDFATERSDEIGLLARVLGSLTTRLQREVRRLRDAERRAAVGDVARQVNHDVKNGLVPIRNVVRHLSEVVDHAPERLPQVFRDRKGTLESSVAYLETLAANYGRLQPRESSRPADLRAVVDEVIRGAAAGSVTLQVDLPPDLPLVRADALRVRRILENLVGNAVDACAGNGKAAPGTVAVSAARVPAERAVRITIKDSGAGMTAEQLERAFEDFYTTKPDGTGLGLSVVRRLVADVEGSLKVQTEPGVGTTVTVTLAAQ
ncbi:MAG TPA: ATP-binding protein [Gemmatimonadales bacterium]|nr:ATP-binding protein [Gemmatimonadales bacterium]